MSNPGFVGNNYFGGPCAVPPARENETAPTSALLRHWDGVHAFLTVKRLGSLSAAAAHLHTSTPTISRTIAALEAELGVRLFERTIGVGVELTPDAHLIVAMAERMDEAARDLFAATSVFRPTP